VITEYNWYVNLALLTRSNEVTLVILSSNNNIAYSSKVLPQPPGHF
jgi:hypothetical protein